MARVVVTLKIMPEGTDIDLDKLKEKSIKVIEGFNKKQEIRAEKEGIGFGLNALKFIFVMDENIGSTEPLEDKLKKIKGVSSVDVVDVRRAVG